MHRVLSFDLDNCLFHCNYSSNPGRHPFEVVNKNRVLLDSILARKASVKELIVMVGSARQSVIDDQVNSTQNDTESGFVAIQKISEYLGAKLDTFLLADVYGNLSDGVSFKRACDVHYTGVHASWGFDKTKITILYGQMHRIASLYPRDQILFDFYDDRGLGIWQSVDILEELANYFGRNPSMMPRNVTLRLHHYEGKNVTAFTPIRGTGPIDADYRQTIQIIKDKLQSGSQAVFVRPNKPTGSQAVSVEPKKPAYDGSFLMRCACSSLTMLIFVAASLKEPSYKVGLLTTGAVLSSSLFLAHRYFSTKKTLTPSSMLQVADTEGVSQDFRNNSVTSMGSKR